MVKAKLSSLLIFLGACTLSMLMACSRQGPHKPVTPVPLDRASSNGAKVSFSDVKPLFTRHCTPCHTWNSDQQMAEGKRERIGAMVASKAMPKADPAKPIQITDRERAMIQRWAMGGASTPGGTAPTDVTTVRDPHLAMVSRCLSCHGPQGTSSAPDIPNLAGHDPAYIVGRLQYFMDPAATGTVMPQQMQAIAREFGLKSSDDPKTLTALTFLGDFFGRYRLSITSDDLAALRKKLSPEDKALYQTGKKLVAENQCLACHLQPDLTPTPMTAMIFAQKRGYLESRLTEFKSGQGGTTMPDIVKPLSAADLGAISLYLNLTHPSEALQ